MPSDGGSRQLAMEMTMLGAATHDNGAQPPRIVVTGLGAITPLGLNVSDTWDGLLAGRVGTDRITRFDPSDLRAQIAGEVRGFDPGNYMDRKEARRLDRYLQFALAVTQEAVADAQLDLDAEDLDRIGAVIGTGIGGIGSILENSALAADKGLRWTSPFLITNMLADSASGRIAIELGIHGPNHAVVSACASGTAAVGEAFEILRRGHADVMISGGVEAAILPLIVAGFDNMGALSRQNEDPARACGRLICTETVL